MSKLRFRLAALGAIAIVACSDGASPSHSDPAWASPHGDVGPPPIGRRADAIQGGKADATSTFAVAVLDDQNGICSGTLIAPNLVLTARHCVADDSGGSSVNCASDRFSAPHAASTLRVSTDSDAAFDTAEYKATKIVVPTDTLFCGNDLALIILDKVVPSSVAMPATPAIDPPLTDRTKFGTKLTAIGYGITAPGANDDGTRRTRTNVPIACIPGDKTLGCDVAEYDMTTAELAAGSGLCDGDSGSGAFDPASIAAGAPIVMGVLSRAADTAGECTDSIYGRTDSKGALLIATAKDAAVLGGYATPLWADPSAPQPDDGGTGAPDGGTEEPTGGAADAATPASGGTTTTTTGCAAAPSPAFDASDTKSALCAVLGVALFAASRRRRRDRDAA